MNWLINLGLEGDRMRLIFRTKNGRAEILDPYYPYFYLVCDAPEEARYLVSQHPLVMDAKIEERYQTVESHEKKPTLKVTTSVGDFRRVAADMRKVPGFKELAETTIPHYFRYIADKGITFFTPYSISGGKFEQQGEDLPELSQAAMTKKDSIPKADVVFTYGGDSFLRGRSGVLSNEMGCFLRDAIHIDLMTDMSHDIYNESTTTDLLELGKERLIRVMELSKISGAKPDIVSRVTPGKLNTYLHMEAAKRNGFIVPDIKKSVERPKSLRLLRTMDKGGTIFYPTPGIYRDIAKCDFASMYPNIIVRYNISPETMHCECPDYIEVPEAGWRICKRRGLIPQGIEKVLRRRLMLKKLMKSSGGEKRKTYGIQQRALKNILVCSFGYLGYSNFVFSNVENKECVMLFGRHMIEGAKAIAEDCGLEVIYGIVDSVFVKGGTEGQYQDFVKRVSAEFSIELELDCIFKAIAFPSSSDRSGVANKYYGITYDGQLESRGIALRHSDAAEFIKEFEAKAVRAILEGDLAGLDSIYSACQSDLMENRIPLHKLAITKSIRKEEYKVNSAHIVAHRLAPDDKGYVIYVHTPDGPKPLELADRADLLIYRRMLSMSLEELLRGIISPNNSSASCRARHKRGRIQGGILPGC